MKNISKFQLILLCIFGFFAVIGVLVFSLSKASSSKSLTSTPIVMWGTFNQSIVSAYINAIIASNKTDIRISYIQKSPDTIYDDYNDAVSSGAGPDALLLDQDLMQKFLPKIYDIPYASLPQATFSSTFIPESSLYLTSEGESAVPFAIDPLVMYWNKDIFTNANLISPPTSWDQFTTLSAELTKKDASLNISQSAVGLGEYANITDAKAIISTLFMQAGNPIISSGTNGESVTLSSTNAPAQPALDFYTQFADPSKQAYTWNRALPDSQDFFIADQLGVYFGFASEEPQIAQKNPNLNFGVTLIPQTGQGTGVKMTFGKMYGLSISRSARNPTEVLAIINFLTNNANLAQLSALSGLPSVRLDSLTPDPSNPASSVFATSALWARAWPDPDPVSTDSIFSSMVENTTSGYLTSQQAIYNADSQLGNLFSQQSQ